MQRQCQPPSTPIPVYASPPSFTGISMRIAIVDDDPSAQQLLQATLEHLGHQTIVYADGHSFLQALGTHPLDMLVVDWLLPDVPGPEVVRATRAHCGMQLPILFATQRHLERDVVEALQAGADDFMSKPLRVPELMARVHALLRRAYPSDAQAVHDFPPYHFDSNGRQVHFHRLSVELKEREYALALHLFRNEGRLLGRRHLHQLFWSGMPLDSRSLDTHISRLRTKLQLGHRQDTGAPPTHLLQSVYGMGYRLERLPDPLHRPPACADEDQAA